MYKVMHYTREDGVTLPRYVTNREYKTLEAAKRKADKVKLGFVIRIGNSLPIYSNVTGA